jgi:hypothetical protein
MRMIHAKAARGEEAFRRFRDRSQELFSSYLYEEADSEDVEAYNYDFDDPEAPHFAWPILYDADFSEFDPRHRQEQLTRAFYDRSFGLFVERLAAWTIPRKDNHGA